MKLIALLFLAATAQAQFQILDANTTASLRGIDAVTPRIAWASGSGGTVLLTTDGGSTWKHCTVPPGGEKLDFRGVQAFDARTAFVLSSGKADLSRLYRTDDGCQTWMMVLTNEHPEGFWDSIRLWDRQNGFLVGDPVDGLMTILDKIQSSSDDQWVDYNYLPAFSKMKGPGESAFAASNSCVEIGEFRTEPGTWRTMWFATGGNSGAWVRILRHRSGGEPEVFETNAVEVHSFPKTPSGGIFSIAFREDLEGVAVGGDYLKPNESVGTAAYSRDSGVTWHPAATTPSGYRSSVAYDPSSKTWLAVGTNGADFSKDDGRNWSPLAGDSATGWNAISFPFVVGGKGKIGKLKAGALGK